MAASLQQFIQSQRRVLPATPTKDAFFFHGFSSCPGTPSPLPSLPMGERVAGGQVRGPLGAARGAIKVRGGLSMARSGTIGADPVKSLVRWRPGVRQNRDAAGARRCGRDIRPRLKIRRALEGIGPVRPRVELNLPDAVAERARQTLRRRRW